ncbi:unnamed protein product [Scytosiphon promiscuus]
MRKLEAMGKDALRAVSGFVVSRPGFGSIAWKEPVDLRGVDIGKVVAIEHKSVSVYDDLDEGEEKPALGEGLNKPTTVTLYGIFPKADDPTDEEKRRYEGRVKKNTEKIGAKLVSYNVDIGEWVFETFHWSRYAMSDDDDDDDDDNHGDARGKAESAKKMPPPPPLGPAGRVPRPRGSAKDHQGRSASARGRRSTKLAMPDTDDESSVADNASDAGGARTAGGGRGDDVEETKMASSDVAGFDSMDTEVPQAHRGGDGDAPWLDPRLSTSNLFPERDPSQTEHMRSSLFDQEQRPPAAAAAAANRRGDARRGDGAEARPSMPLLLPEPVVPRPQALRNPEDAKAAEAFRPVAGGLQSKVLRSLGDAWKPSVGEVSDSGARGTVRAGQVVADCGLRMGRGFRASWGPDGKIFCPRAMGGGGGGGKTKGFHGVRVSRFDPTPAASGRDVDGLYVEPLRNHLRHAQQLTPGGLSPRGPAREAPPLWALPKRRSDRPENYAALVRCIHGYVKVHRSTGAATARGPAAAAGVSAAEDSPEWVLEQSWRLASAMWGQEEGEGRAQDLPLPGELDRGLDFGYAGDGDGASPSARREAAVGDWLAQAVASCVSSTGGGSGGGEGEEWESWRRVLELLSVRRVQEAARVAMSAGLPRLAVVLTAVATQGVGRPPARYGSKFIAQQAGLWQAHGADARMPREAFAVYQLLGREGFRDVGLRGVIGTGKGSLRPSLDWMRQLGLCMWFGAGAFPAAADDDNAGGGGGGAVATAVDAYEALVEDGEALPPNARYFAEPTHHARVHLEEVCQELRRAYGGGGASGVALLSALEPMSVTPDVMDYRHSWHLMNVVEALGVAEVPDRAKAAAIAEGLRFQLVSAGLWEWAVYVALTAEGDADGRVVATARELVLRHGHGLLDAPFGSPDEKRRELLQRLGVPTTWLHEAAAVRAGYDHRSALMPPACKLLRSATPSVGTVTSGEGRRDAKLNILIAAESSELVGEAAKEACALAPGSIYLGGDALSRLAAQFGRIARQMESSGAGMELVSVLRGGERGNMDLYRGVGGANGIDGGLVGKEFEAFKEIVEAATAAEATGGRRTVGWSGEEIERLERMRRVVQPAAARVVGAAASHQVLESIWKNAGIEVPAA